MNYPKECQIFQSRFLVTLTVLCGLLLFASCGRSLQSHLTRGEDYLQKRQFEEAVMQFRAATQIDDKSAEAHWGLGRAYEAQGKFIETVEELRKVADLAPDNLEAKAKLGNYYLLFTPPQIEESEKILQDIFKRNPNFIEGHILKASIFSAKGKSEKEVLAALDKAISIDKKRTESYLAKSRFYMEIKKVDEAEEVIREAISVNPKQALGYLEYGRFLAYADRRVEAEENFQKAIEVEPQNIEARESLANYYLAERQLEKAEKAYQDLVQIHENSPESRMDLASFYNIIGRDVDAIEIYHGILKDFPDYARARYKLAEIHLARKELDKVNQEIEKLLAINDKDFEALMFRARVKLVEDNPEEAVKDLEEVLKKQPSLQTALFYMTLSRLALGQVDQARAFIGDLEKYHPTYKRSALLKIQAAFTAGEPELALQEANKLIRLTEKAAATNTENGQEIEDLRVRAITSRGIANLQLGYTEEAEKDLQEVVRLSPGSAGAKINLARVHVVKKELEKALSLYENVMSTEAKDFDALSGMVGVLTKQRKFDKAKNKVDQMIQLVGNDKRILPALHYLKSDIFSAENKIDTAESELKKAIELDENYLPAYSAYASILITKNQTDAALAQYRKVVEKKPSAAVYTLIGMLEDAKQNYDEAEKNYRKALEINPGTEIAANNLAWMIADQNRGNLDEALRLAQDTVNRNNNVAGYYDTLGWVNYKKGFHVQAVESFKRAVALDEAHAKAEGKTTTSAYRLRLGMALALAGNKDLARKEVAIALQNGKAELSPEDIQNAKSILSGS